MPNARVGDAADSVAAHPAPLHLLVIEDDRQISAQIDDYLTEAGMIVTLADNGEAGLRRALEDPFDAVILDRMLPGLDGMEVLHRLRARDAATPVLMLTARAGVPDRVEGLEAGASDYLTKPFALAELLARVRALVRSRSHAVPDTVLRAGPLMIDVARHSVRRDGVTVTLQPREFRCLLELAREPGTVVSRALLLERVWEYRFDPHTKILETHMSRLRAKLNAGGKPDLIETVRSAGYRLAV
ncbi:DNA-binding response regulator [Sphingomonas metalli]|uniref:DNA-binding response regulator n=1 Tax=Sphingomonas metalli TaxID=1779358 RepID=A0A916TDC2_9SPHN|nr:response regulator transcription factor [Sphingomonas metalli]GGB40671.1 DNA-binding response regulator [Sphingomonas metalli]